MKIYFAQNKPESEFFETDGSFFHPETGVYYWFYVEFGTNPGGLDEVTIADGCERSIPVSLDHIDDLIEALNRVKELHQQIQDGQAAQELAEGNSAEAIPRW